MTESNHPPPIRDLVFISYAYEDEVFAKWLARKLASFGYGVWFDQMKILGGESWVEEVEVAITENSIRVLAILSKSSISKPNPRKERTKALDVGRTFGISDFLITLNLDGTKPDWTISDISYISFQESWADGLRRVLKKLEALSSPRILADQTHLVAETLESGNNLIIDEPETILSNWLPLPGVPEILKVFDTSKLSMEEVRSWPNYELEGGKVAAFTVPSGEIGSRVSETREAHLWHATERIRTHNAQHVVTRILNRAVDNILRSSGCMFCRENRLYYIPDEFQGEGLVRYVDSDGEKRFIRTSGIRTFRKPAGAPEKVTHRPAARVKVRRIAEERYVVQIDPAVALFDSSGKPITGKAVGPRRKKVTLNWFNHNWRKRLLVFAQILRRQSLDMGVEIYEVNDPMSFQTDRSLQESRLVATTNDDEEDEKEIVIGMDEIEEWST
jgi:hypothetical protein